MSRSYAYHIGLSWPDYLKVNEISGVGDDVRQLRDEVSSSNRKIIATYEELQREHITATKLISDAVSSGFEQLSFDMQAISSGITELTSVFEWGFSELIAGVGRINDLLSELVQIAKTPAQTWAYEQFEIARDAFRQGLYEEALEYLNRSIEGYGGNTGYKLEYRFHFLLGTIRMGSFQNNSQDIVKLNEAENAFLNAARYARQDYPKEAGRAFLAAGWTAYCQGKMPGAEQYTEQALSFYPDLAEAHFQSAKFHMHVGNPDRALPFLKQAIELDRGYSIKAAADNDFKRYEAKVHALLGILRQEAKEKAEKTLVATQKQAVETEKQRVQEFTLTKYAELAPAKHALNEASGAAQHHTYFGYLDALSFCAQARQNLLKATADFVTGANAEVKQRIAELNNRIYAVNPNPKEVAFKILMTLGIITSLILAYIGSQGSIFGFVIVLLLGWFLSVCIAVTGERIRTRITIATLKGEKDQLERANSEIQRIQAQ